MRFNFPDSVPAQALFQERQINELRKSLGLATKRSFTTKLDGTQAYSPNPDQSEVTSFKTARGFTYLNLNGGDSFAYWHPTDSFEYIHNFKGEPVYRTSELAPHYYLTQLKDKQKLLTGTRAYYVFRDPRSDAYFAGWHDSVSDAYQFNQVSNKEKLFDFLQQYSIPKPKIISDWTCTYDPQNKTQVDSVLQYWNKFQPSSYMAQSLAPSVPGSFPSTLALISHVLGAEPDSNSPLVRGFLNWLAFAFQKRLATGTAWLLQGVPGTGKGLLANYIIKPLFGPFNYTARRMEELEDKFNGYLEACLVCYVDEVHVGVSKRADIILANLKNQITEPSITIRNMRQQAYETPNYLNWIMSSNMSTPIQLDQDDRRFNVGNYQVRNIREVFPDTTTLVQSIQDELPAFASYLQTYSVDASRVRLPIKNEARSLLIENSLTSLDVVGNAVTSGNFELLASFMGSEADILLQIKAEAYTSLLKDLAKTKRNKLSREELNIIFSYTVGGTPSSPAKFTRFLAHHGIKLKKIRVNDRTTMGIDVEWVISEDLRQEIITGKAPALLTSVISRSDNEERTG